MRILYSWLRELVELAHSPGELGELLTQQGTELEELIPLGEKLSGAEFATLISRRGGSAVLDIRGRVVEAECPWPLREGDRVAVDPGRGAILTWDEAGLSPARFPILLPEGLEEGELREDAILEFAVVSNRGDLLSHLGMAREVVILTGGELSLPELADLSPGENDGQGKPRINLPEPDHCPRYVGLGFEEVKHQPSPAWLLYRLSAMGITPREAVVDLSNYILFELGQPLHTFDWDRLAEDITVEQVGSKAKFSALDENDYELFPEVLAIKSGGRPVALAGIIGGRESAVSEATKRVFLESAWFQPVTIRQAAYRLGIRTESSLRFGRGVDPEGTRRGALRFARLAEELGVARVLPHTLVDVDLISHAPTEIPMSLDWAEGFLGFSLDQGEVSERLTRAGLALSSRNGALVVRVPSWRFDLAIPEDVAEEIARLAGYDRVPSRLPVVSLRPGHLGRRWELRSRIRELLTQAGYQETITYSLTGPDLLSRLYGEEEFAAVEVKNPDTRDMSLLQPTLMVGLMETLRENLTRRVEPLPPFFEIARTFHPGKALAAASYELSSPDGSLTLHEVERLGLIARRATPPFPPWRSPTSRLHPLFRLKGTLEYLLQSLGVEEFSFPRLSQPSQAWLDEELVVTVGDQPVGYLGRASTRAKELFDLEEEIALAELNLDALLPWVRRHLPVRAPSDFPPVRRDLALVVELDTPAGELEQAIRELAGQHLSQCFVFDQYTGPRLREGEGKKSLAFRLIFRSHERTLTNQEVDEAIFNVLVGVHQRFGAVLRDYESLRPEAMFEDPARWKTLLRLYRGE